MGCIFLVVVVTFAGFFDSSCVVGVCCRCGFLGPVVEYQRTFIDFAFVQEGLYVLMVGL